MTITYKALSALLAYPSADLVAALPDIAAIVEREPRLGRPQGRRCGARDGARDGRSPRPAGAYVALFDRGRATSLHLFEHVHGDSRERGQAMVDLKAIYAPHGFVLAGNELPDYLPAVLEYLSQRPEAEAKEMLGDCAHILRAVGEALQDRGSDYSAVFAAALAMVGEPGLAARRPAKPAARDKPIDEEWVDEPVIFGPAGAPGAACRGPNRRDAVQPRRA